MNRVLQHVVFAALLLAGAMPTAAAEPQGIRGRASLAGVLVEDVSIRAYPYRTGTFGPLTGESPAGSALTATDGTYEIPLPSGRYVVEARKASAATPGDRPETGELHCLYSGSPVTVAPGAWTSVGLNLVEVPRETRESAEHSAIVGRITFGGKPVEKVYLYVYTDAATGFRGPAYYLQPVAKGTFRLRVPPGTYHLVARKRLGGGAYGPIEIGDFFNFYSRNPVGVESGEEVEIEIPLVERLSQLEEDPGAFQGVSVRVVGQSGTGQPGFYVLAYSSPLRSGPPLATSSRTDAAGRARLPLAPGQTTYLRARQTLGGPLREGESFADGQTVGGVESEVVLTLGGQP